MSSGAKTARLVKRSLAERYNECQMKRKHDDTTVSLHPLTFDEAIAELAQSKRGDSEAADSGSTKEPAHGAAP